MSEILEESTTPLDARDLFTKYGDFQIDSLKVSIYRIITLTIFQSISIIKEIGHFPPIPEVKKVDFQFKKIGFKRLLIFDLDETLIHTVRDPTEDGEEDMQH